ncbi:type II toxin-antitoxin system YafQ family toxin [Beijerinckia sp. L45]|uniref:type II toxin-antitoxin system RelE/ParE family toxin n=1 Tax=Beijerinckia sp. L45 TaxID=1641855 RepID=UPI00131C4A3F|nr:type II toxin-antitoxin system YafQ family toxin [Beijerinckia sp. L45]
MPSTKAPSAKRAALPRQIAYSKQFLKDYERYNRAGRSDMARLREFVLIMVTNEASLHPQWKDHAIDTGEFAGTGMRDAHIHGDFLVLYRIIGTPEIVVFERLGTHSELFG